MTLAVSQMAPAVDRRLAGGRGRPIARPATTARHPAARSARATDRVSQAESDGTETPTVTEQRRGAPPTRVVLAWLIAGLGTPVLRRSLGQRQSTATDMASQTSRSLSSLSRPRRSTRTATETLSMASRFTALGLGTGSTPGSSVTSLGSPRIVVVHGATSVRPRRGMAASRLSTTTGRRPMSGSSHHQTYPRRGEPFTMPGLRLGTMPGRPTRRARRSGARRRRGTPRRLRHDDARPRAR